MLEIDATLVRPRFRLEVAVRFGRGITGIVGPSGAGKTTLLEMIAGLLRPTAGRIAISGDVVCDIAEHVWMPPHQRSVGLVYQNALLLPHYRVRGNLLYGWRGTRSEGEAAVRELARDLEIEHLLDRRVGGLSGGERQRVAIGRAVLSRPRLLLMDEPWAALDPELRWRMVPLIRQMHERARVPIVVVSHHQPELRGLTDQIVRLQGGRCVSDQESVPTMSSRSATLQLASTG